MRLEFLDFLFFFQKCEKQAINKEPIKWVIELCSILISILKKKLFQIY